MQTRNVPQTQAAPSGPIPVAAEWLQFIGGGVGQSKPTTTPQAPKSTW